VVANTHIHWNPKFDYVKYAQGFWLVHQIDKLLTENGLSLTGASKTPLIICGDFNSRPSNSIIHLMNNIPYFVNAEGRDDKKKGVVAFRNEKQDGVNKFKTIDRDV
jgi:mRNA deadenylase 3'-5' endonuclease subunit Ccr4